MEYDRLINPDILCKRDKSFRAKKTGFVCREGPGQIVFMAVISYDQYKNVTPIIIGYGEAEGFEEINEIGQDDRFYQATQGRYKYFIELKNGHYLNGPYQSPVLTLAPTSILTYISDQTLTEIQSPTAYEKNENGETFGSALSAETIGHEPDLIAAIGTNGVEGYVRSSDFDTGVTSPEEAIAYMNSFSDSIANIHFMM